MKRALRRIKSMPMARSIFHTCILQPGSSETIYFTAPAPGEYTYVCTFPGHSWVMRSKMIVRGRKTAER